MKRSITVYAFLAVIISGGLTLTASAQERPENSASGQSDDVRLDRLRKMQEERTKNSTVPKVEAPKSICAGDTVDKVENFFSNLKVDVCNMVDTEPDVAESKYRYENPDGGCDIGLKMPGLPDFGFSADGFDACELVKTVSSDMVSKANTAARDGLNNALDSVKNKAGIEDFDLSVDANDVIEGDENFRD